MIFGWSSIMLKCHLKCDTARWDRELSGRKLSSSPQNCVTAQTAREGESYHRGGWTDEIWDRQWGWQTNSRGHWGQPVGRDTVWAKIISYCLAWLLLHVQCESHRDLNSLLLKGMNSLSVPDTWLSQVCLINFGIYNFDFSLIFKYDWLYRTRAWHTVGGKCLFMHVTSRVLVWIILHLHVHHLDKVTRPARWVYALSIKETWCISIGCAS